MFPENVAEFKRVSSDLITRDMGPKYGSPKAIGANSGLVAVYESSSSKASLTAWNFPTADNALEALHLMKLDARDAAKEEGPKTKGGKEVGARFTIDPNSRRKGSVDIIVTTPSNPQGNPTNSQNDESLTIAWTNGSVLFSLEAKKKEDAFRLESSLPY